MNTPVAAPDAGEQCTVICILDCTYCNLRVAHRAAPRLDVDPLLSVEAKDMHRAATQETAL